MEVSTITNFRNIQNNRYNNYQPKGLNSNNNYHLGRIQAHKSPNFGLFIVDDLFCWGMRKLNTHRENLRYQQIKKVHQKVGNDIEILAKRMNISKEKAAERYHEDLNIGGIEPRKDGYEVGLNKVLGYSLEKLEMIKKVVVPIIKTQTAKLAGKEIPKDVIVPNGILIHGAPGTGKSHMADSLLEHLNKKGVNTITINQPWHKGDTDENIFAIWKTFEKAQKDAKNGKHTVIQINEFDKIINHPNAEMLQNEFAYQTQHPAKDGVTWIATTNDKSKLPDWMFDKNRTSIVMPLGEMKSDAEVSSVLSHFIAKSGRKDNTDHDIILDYMKKKNMTKTPGKIQELVKETDRRLNAKDSSGEYGYGLWDVGYHTKSMQNKDIKKAIDKIAKDTSKKLSPLNDDIFRNL